MLRKERGNRPPATGVRLRFYTDLSSVRCPYSLDFPKLIVTINMASQALQSLKRFTTCDVRSQHLPIDLVLR